MKKWKRQGKTVLKGEQTGDKKRQDLEIVFAKVKPEQ